MHVFSFSNRVFLRRGRGAYEAQANDFEHGGARLFLIIQVLYGLAKHRIVVHQSVPTDVWYLPYSSPPERGLPGPKALLVSW